MLYLGQAGQVLGAVGTFLLTLVSTLVDFWALMPEES